MTTTRWLLALASVVVLSSCASRGGVGVRSPECRTQKCDVDISVDSAGNVTFDPDVLQVFIRDSHIVWHLPAGYEFCPQSGDGIFFKNPKSGQFVEGYATDDGEPSTDKECKKKYHWKDKKTEPSRTEHPYGVKFRDKAGKRFDVDPIIINDM